VRADLARIAVHQPLGLLARIMRTGGDLRQDFAGARLISDQHNELDHLYLAPDRLAYLPYDPRAVLGLVAAQSPALAGLLEPVLTHLGRLRHHVEAFPLYAVTPDPGIRLSDVDWRRIAGLQWQSEVLTTQGDTGRARQALEAALALAPEQPANLLRLARLLMATGQNGPAQDYLRVFQRIEPEDPMGFASMGDALQAEGRAGLALAQYERAAALAPDWWVPQNSVAWILAAHPDPAQRRPAAAISAAARAVELSGGSDPSALDTLATAFAAAGRFGEAVATGKQALALAEVDGAEPLARGIRERLRLFAAGQIVVDAKLAP
jgi:tetratricopeptide (TPR) repeat protein